MGPAPSEGLGSLLFPKVQRLLCLAGRLTCVRSGCAVKKSSPGIVNEDIRNKRLEQGYFLTDRSVYKVKLQR